MFAMNPCLLWVHSKHYEPNDFLKFETKVVVFLSQRSLYLFHLYNVASVISLHHQVQMSSLFFDLLCYGLHKEAVLVLSSHSKKILDSEPSWGHEHVWVLTGSFGFLLLFSLHLRLMLSPPCLQLWMCVWALLCVSTIDSWLALGVLQILSIDYRRNQFPMQTCKV